MATAFISSSFYDASGKACPSHLPCVHQVLEAFTSQGVWRRPPKGGQAAFPFCVDQAKMCLPITAEGNTMGQMVATDMLAYILGLIYDCAIEPERWPIAMEAIRVELGCAVGVLGLHTLPDAKLIAQHSVNVPSAYIAPEVDRDEDAANVWGGSERLMSLPINQPLVLSLLNPNAMPFGTETTNRASLGWAKPQGLQDVIGVFLARDPGAFGILAFPRHLEAGLVSQREIEFMRTLIPHLQRVATINRLIEAAERKWVALQNTIDLLSVAVIITDGRMRVLHANSAGHRMLAQGDIIREQAGLLVTRSSAGTHELRAAIERPSAKTGSMAKKRLSIPIAGPQAVSGVLQVLPLGQVPQTSDTSRPTAAVFAAHSGFQIPPTDVVASLYGLTPSETRVFNLLLIGNTMADIARILGVELSTVKTHAMRLYAKVGVSRRTELQRLATALTIPLAS